MKPFTHPARPPHGQSSLPHRRRALAVLTAAVLGGPVGGPLGLVGSAAAATSTIDPYGSLPWEDMQREHLGPGARVVFDDRVRVQGPAFAEDPMNVPISVVVEGLARVERIIVLVDRNPIRKVLEYRPETPAGTLPSVSFRFKLEQASPVRAAALDAQGVWHVGGTFIDSSGGGCTVPGATRADGSWSQTLGLVNGRVFDASPAATAADTGSARLRVRVMHPMDTGLVSGVPAFYLSRLTLRDGDGRTLLQVQPFEPVSENPVFSFDFAHRPRGPLRLVGVDNNGNRVDSPIE